MKNKGYTLIEMLITMSIASTIFALTANIMINHKSYYTNINTHLCNNTILSIINSAKLYCRKEEKEGYILVDVSNNNVRFFCNGARIEKFDLPSGFSLYSINTDKGKINIDKFGLTGDACTITYKDNIDKTHKITMSVGTSYVEIKE